MKKILNRVLLIDDSEADNFIHSRRLRKSGVVKEIIIKENGKEALKYLASLIDQARPGVHPQPELVFLDINMPVMNGWEFLDAYREIPDEQRARTIVTMLTTSTSERDKIIAKNYPEVVDTFLEKPLTEEKIREIVNRYF